MKGRAKIQLFDKDQNLVFEKVEENLVTNTVKKIVNLEGKDFFKGHRASSRNVSFYHIPQVTPIATQLYGGLLLFGDTLPEDAETIFPPAGVKSIGHAGSPYSGANPYRGSYNASESGTLYSGTSPVGYKHVWDFATDRANGVIKSMCLTSIMGGNVGWKTRGVAYNGNDSNYYDADASIDTFVCGSGALPFKVFEAQSSPSVSIFDNVCTTTTFARLIYVDEDTGTFYFAMGSSSQGNGIINKVSLPAEKTLSIFEETRDYSGSSLEMYINMGRNTYNPYGYFKFDKATGNVEHIHILNETTLIHEVFNTSSQVVDSTTVSISGSGSLFVPSGSASIPPFFYKGHYYAQVTGNRLLKLSTAGEILETIDISAFVSSYWYVSYSSTLDRIVLKTLQSYSYRAVEVMFDGVSFESYRANESGRENFITSESSDSSFPGAYVMLPSSSYYSKPVYFKIYPNYIATINNLAEPITKTSATTMKVTYEIYTT